MTESDLIKKVSDLLPFYAEKGNERVGYILNSGEIVELTNIAEKPQDGFYVSGDEIQKYGDDAVATWHTHPAYSSNLSGEDYEFFSNWPDLFHFIVGKDGVRMYKYDESRNAIVEGHHETGNQTRLQG